MFNGKWLDELLKVDHINRMVTETLEAFNKLRLLGCIDVERGGPTGWRKPRSNEVKVNVDGFSIPALMRAGVACVLRDHQGNWITGACRMLAILPL